MKHILPILLMLTTITLPSLGELLENGDFAKDLNYWNLNRGSHYGTETTAKLVDGVLHLGGLSPTKPGYLILAQAVDVEEGKTYRVSFEAMGEDGAKFNYSIGDHRFGKVASSRAVLAGSDWTEVSADLTAKCSTDSSWYKKAHKLAKKNTLTKKGRTTALDEKKRPKKLTAAGACVFALGLGGLDNEVALRNFSIVEVE